MRNIFSQVEIVFWDTAIALMSREKMPRVYSHTLAALTLRLQPIYHQPVLKHLRLKINLPTNRIFRLIFISVVGLFFGLLLGWMRSS